MPIIGSKTFHMPESWRAAVFAYRGMLLAIPALILVILGKPAPLWIAIGFPLACLGEVLRCWAVGYSGVTTRADTVTAPALVSSGPYAYVRNPLYVGNFITALGFALAFTGGNQMPMRAGLIAAALGTMLAVYAVIIPHEEAYLRSTFGRAFDEYVARVPALIPRLGKPLPAELRRGTYERSVIAEAESRTLMMFAAMLSALIFKAIP